MVAMMHSSFWLRMLVVGALVSEGAPSLTGSRTKIGVPRLSDNRIVGGQDAEPGQFPYQVSFQYKDSHLCGGSILNEMTVITAAHCCESFSAAHPHSVTVIAGEHSFADFSGTEQSVEVVELRLHEAYDTVWLENDVCLMILAEPLAMNDFVTPIDLPLVAFAEPEEGAQFIASGWGALEFEGPRPDTLQWVTVPYVNDELCNELLQDIVSSMLCAGNVEEGGVDTCNGDSGGPLVTTDDGGSPTLLGLTSWGYGCADPGKPGVYTQVSHFLDWIAANLAA